MCVCRASSQRFIIRGANEKLENIAVYTRDLFDETERRLLVKELSAIPLVQEYSAARESSDSLVLLDFSVFAAADGVVKSLKIKELLRDMKAAMKRNCVGVILWTCNPTTNRKNLDELEKSYLDFRRMVVEAFPESSCTRAPLELHLSSTSQSPNQGRNTAKRAIKKADSLQAYVVTKCTKDKAKGLALHVLNLRNNSNLFKAGNALQLPVLRYRERLRYKCFEPGFENVEGIDDEESSENEDEEKQDEGNKENASGQETTNASGQETTNGSGKEATNSSEKEATNDSGQETTHSQAADKARDPSRLRPADPFQRGVSFFRKLLFSGDGLDLAEYNVKWIYKNRATTLPQSCSFHVRDLHPGCGDAWIASTLTNVNYFGVFPPKSNPCLRSLCYQRLVSRK